MRKKKCYLYNFPSLSREIRVREPSVLYCVPDPRRWDTEFVFADEVRPDGDLYLCTVFTCGLEEFKAFSGKVGPERVIAGGYHPSLCPGDFAGLARKVVTGYGNNIDEIIAAPRGGVIAGEFRPNHMDRSVFPLGELKEAWFADVFPGRRSLSINTFMGCPFPCDFSDNCYIRSTYGDRRHYYGSAYVKEELKRLEPLGYDYLFVRDEGFFRHPEFYRLLGLLGMTRRRIYSFLGPLDGLDEARIKLLKAAGWFCLTFGFNVEEGSPEDPEKLRVAELAHKHGINLHLNLVIKGGRDKRSEYYMESVGGLLRRYLPASAETYFWTPYPGTRSFEEYHAKFAGGDYRLLRDRNFKDGGRALRERHQRNLLRLQAEYYRSAAYARLREFDCGDALNLRMRALLGRRAGGA